MTTTVGVRKPGKPRGKSTAVRTDVARGSGEVFATVKVATANRPAAKAKPARGVHHGMMVHKDVYNRSGDDFWTLDSLLGLHDEEDATARDLLAISSLIRRGLPLSVMDNLKDAGVDGNYRNMIIPPRTLQHRANKGEPLSPTESERAYRVANIVGLADQVFANHEKGLRWLHKPMKALGGKSPLDVLDNEPGARMVEYLLGRLDEGYFA